MRVLVCILFFGLIFAQHQNDFQKTSILFKNNSKNDPVFIKSLLIPGWGQFSNGQSLWRSALFISAEIILIYSNVAFNKKAISLQNNFERYGDKHWDLERWYLNTQRIFPQNWKDILIGTHKLGLKINQNYYHSDILVELLEKYEWNKIDVIRDRDFYENIGKYDQFVGGWDDGYDDPFDSIGNWFSVKKGNVESIILTRKKDYYRNLRFDSNKMKHYARYAVTGTMINHLLSAIDAELRKSEKRKKYQFQIVNNYKNGLIVNGVKFSYLW
tara:strand:+ start:429 stop:1241 length:813 start_codon:yes stop_codon:yes gene_type:complete